MIHQELKDFIEQHCSGVEPSEAIMDVIASKIVQYGDDGDEVLAYVEECSKGLTLKEKQREAKHDAEREADRQARIEEAKHKAISDAKNAEMAADKALTAMANAETKRAEADTLKEKRHQQDIERSRRKSKVRTYVVSSIVFVILAVAGIAMYLNFWTGKSVAELMSEAAYNSVNSESIEDIEVNTDDVPSDDPSIVIDADGDVKAQLEKHYEMVYAFNAGFYKLKDHGKYGLADAKGKIIQKPKFNRIGTKNKLGLIKVENDGKIGFLNLKGVLVLAPTYTEIEDPSEGLMKVKDGELFGFINANTLKEVAPCKYTYIYSLQDGKYKVLIGKKEGFLDKDGNVVQEPK